MTVEIIAWKYIQDDQDYTIEVRTELKTVEDFIIHAQNHMENMGRYQYKLYKAGSFISAFKTNTLK